eukprot:gnl/TRDRNA2_/TRDRNA2_144440_c1_seq1.p1 gnl/TRDRNA2_/TRDRNA2_144440_c1~~gnl/TRDRNA2_/TRDRNA2_144440_c1_seq1.p1  ORF type:complete len:100 (-),score=5.88 gnl/TRDRNA2_/TRDRNA2_144440_c1_seq1:33-332(-)
MPQCASHLVQASDSGGRLRGPPKAIMKLDGHIGSAREVNVTPTSCEPQASVSNSGTKIGAQGQSSHAGWRAGGPLHKLRTDAEKPPHFRLTSAEWGRQC